MYRPAHLVSLVVLALASTPACDSTTAESPAAEVATGDAPTIPAPVLTDTAATDLEGIHNVVAYGPGLFSGAAPEGDHAFATLASMGVKTIVSVDGAVPDVEGAAAEGIRYVHLPITYSGMSHERSLEISRAVRDLPGPVYVHCHHGKHRSAAAAGVAAVELGILTPEEAVARMKVSGTAPTYTGLYACVENAAPQAADAIDRADATFPSTSRPTGITESMVDIDELHEHLKAIDKAGWLVPADHPDLVPLNEAARLADIFRNLKSDPTLADRPADFHELLSDAGQSAHDLEDMIASGAGDVAAMTEQFKLVSKDCKSCHMKYRD